MSATDRDQFEVNGTTFSFGKLLSADEMMPGLYEKLKEHRDGILATAAKVKFKPLPMPRPFRGPKPGNGDFVPKPGQPGAPAELADGTPAEVWALAPGGYRWLVADGRYFHTGGWGEMSPEKQRDEIIAEVVHRSFWIRVRAFTAERTPPAGVREHGRWLLDIRVHIENTIKHELYPSHYPDPGVFAAELGESAVSA
jgi:hypothetical protein